MPTPALQHLAETLAALDDFTRLRDDELVDAVRMTGQVRRLTDAIGVRAAAELERRCEPGGPDAPDRSRGHVGAPV